MRENAKLLTEVPTEDLIAELKRRDEYKITVETPAGSIIAKPYGAKDDYPAIWIMKDENTPFNMIAAVEYITPDKELHIEGYGAGYDEPIMIADYETGEILK